MKSQRYVMAVAILAAASLPLISADAFAAHKRHAARQSVSPTGYQGAVVDQSRSIGPERQQYDFRSNDTMTLSQKIGSN